MRLRYGKRDALISLIEPSVIYISIAFVIIYIMWPYVYYAKNETIIVIGLFAFWRYGWLSLNMARGFIYNKFVYKGFLKKIEKLDEEKKYPDHIYFLIPSYKEEAWVSIETFKSIFNELLTIPSHATIIVSTSGSSEEDTIIEKLYRTHTVRKKVDLIFQHQKEGKRIAMGHGLRAIARRYLKEGHDYHSVTFFMDGDSYLEKGFLKKLLPHFAIDPKLGALTTNEAAFIKTNSNWYKDWFNLKFGQRHMLFQSHSLSNKVLTLTGRLSAYRTKLVIEDEFIRRLENDVITTVMHGKFRFLMGDDKTTWYNLLKDGWNMRYLPDTLCYSLESRDADFLELSRSLPYRWYGNTLRNTNRALALGPKHVGFFIWWAILDQRISMWTSLVGITGAIILGIFKAFYYFLFYFAWILLVRTIQIAFIAYNGHIVSWRSLPLMLYGQWIGSFVKIKALFNISDQKWSKGGDVQSSDDSVAKINHPLVNVMPDFMMVGSYLFFIFVMLLSHDALALPDMDVLKSTNSVKYQFFEAEKFGVSVDDGKDDSIIINKLIQKCDGIKPCNITLPEGKIDLYHSLLIDKNNIVLEGKSREKTIIISHLHTKDTAAIYIKGSREGKIGFIKEDTKLGNVIIEAKLKDSNKYKYILIRTPNTDSFLNSIGSQVWKKKYPYLRQQIFQMYRYNQVTNLLTLSHKSSTIFPKNISEIWGLNLVENIKLQKFTIAHNIKNKSIQSVQFLYENPYPSDMVDMIRFEYASNISTNNIKILNSGRHPLVMENVLKANHQNLYINGAWNKGKKGSGYVRFARTYNATLRNSEIKNIRHITLQWSSANNLLENLTLKNVDINFHGGYAHDNLVRNIKSTMNPRHPWKEITFTPLNAKYAPPDGPHNLVEHIQVSH